ncbi:flagellar motor switch protein FliN/FliY [Caldanaerobius fijiensis DSM 17918]|uniref:Flagellar motor switch protein FliN/FliY n=1 Tax=Caldanaerobius fijiensis DSM 17918 TaxID=1121256 RepID=A0A1M4XLY3_9THEO|nr:flagellar motor switch phosphatase FliY [Caldanaerobius fijiensis]SHE94479.1 flagellar motor switch protein FliN/FliY [Caldanaerobius fijiensis DSM 17918]
MDDNMLSQEEIDALLKAVNSEQNSSAPVEDLTDQEKDVLGEIGNISMGTSATTLYTLLRNKVSITTPQVKVMTWDELRSEYAIPYVGVLVEYVEGLKGFTMLILKIEDAKKIADLMMGGDGTNADMELSEIVLSAVGEAMNQMVGSASVSLSNMLYTKINISPPKVYVVNFDSDEIKDIPIYGQKIVRISFKMIVGDIIKSEIMQLLPLDFAKALVEKLLSGQQSQSSPESTAEETGSAAEESTYKRIDDVEMRPSKAEEKEAITSTEKSNNAIKSSDKTVKVSPVKFQELEDERVENISNKITLIKDVPLEVTVELGRTHKLIKEILELGPGSIIELNKMAGEPVDILVNGKNVAKGEVVVIDENFGVRITEIL